MSEEEARTVETAGEPVPKRPTPSLLRNYISFTGFAIIAASLTSITLLILIELTGSSGDNPYSDLITFILIPSILGFGIFVVLVGALWERRRRRLYSDDEIPAYPVLDLNDPRRRRTFLVFLCVAFAFLFISGFGSYRAFEYTESVTFCGQACHNVMKPEFIAYNASNHAKVACVECHVGGGAQAYAYAKFNGMHQLYGVITGHFNRPIETPVKNMREATQTCQKCHWSEKYYGDQLKVFNHYEYDQNNSLNQTRMLIKVGGGDPKGGPVGGIHWHMNIANEVTFISTDDKREVIPWVRMKDASGKVVEYTAKDSGLSSQQIEQGSKRKMDCIDCHNRPTHDYLSPNQAVDRSLDAGSLDIELPFIKAKAVETLSKPYNTNDEAVATIATDVNDYYRTNFADVFSSKKDSVDKAVTELQRIYQTYFFPEMKTDWKAHPNNIGHYNAQGCFRCHDGQHFSTDGKVIRNECSVCHVTLDQSFAGKKFTPDKGVFQHPVNLGDKNTWQCAACHKGDRTFKHPLNLGDISKFQCVECHKGQAIKMAGF
ncbi:MAG: NapC/NirT family cytochrome c [Acidobacteriota bacterium]